MRDRIGHVTRARLALGSDHGRALGDASQCLAQVGGTAHEGNGELPLVDVVGVVGGREDLGLVDVVDAQGLDHLRLSEVADACLGHDGDSHRVDDPLDHVGI